MTFVLNSTALRPYQREAVASVGLSLHRHGSSRVHVVAVPTGAGKTLIGAAIAHNHLKSHPGGQVLWLAPRWELLSQALTAWREKIPGNVSSVGRAGGDPRDLNLHESMTTSLVFSTLQTCFARRYDAGPGIVGRRDQLVILDESHWAVDAQQGQWLRESCLGKTQIVGLTATPQPALSKDRIAYQKSFAELCSPHDGGPYLATPRVTSVDTGIVWSPVAHAGVISNESFNQLVRASDRNRKVVSTVAAACSSGEASRVILFACNQVHADGLSDDFNKLGIKAVSIHAGVSKSEQTHRLREFREGRVQIAVSCTMLAVGLDVPEIDTVAIARPSESVTLLAQMIGRGARLTENKRHFSVIEFTDRLMSEYQRIFHASDYVGPLEIERTGKSQTRRRPKAHEESDHTPTFHRVKVLDLPELSFVADQTFGVEIELTYSHFLDRNFQWFEQAQKVLGVLKAAAEWPVADKLVFYRGNRDFTKWQVTYDGSCGVEVVSPILVNEHGFQELGRISRALRKLLRNDKSLYVDHRCGLHITLATKLNTESRRKAFLNRLSRLESGLYTLVAPSRLFAYDGSAYDRRCRSRYCSPIREASLAHWELCLSQRTRLGRYRSVNVTKGLGDMHLLEVRMHHGTTDYRKIIPWICLWMAIFNHDRYAWKSEPELSRIFSGGNQRLRLQRAEKEDLFQQLFLEEIYLDEDLDQLLRRRRQSVSKHWAKVLPKRVQGWERAGWYDTPLHAAG